MHISRTLIVAVALVTGSAAANVTVNTWSDNTHFHHKRIQVPDQDQKRDGLPNDGRCYCVPTSHLNMLMYIFS